MKCILYVAHQNESNLIWNAPVKHGSENSHAMYSCKFRACKQHSEDACEASVGEMSNTKRILRKFDKLLMHMASPIKTMCGVIQKIGPSHASCMALQVRPCDQRLFFVCDSLRVLHATSSCQTSCTASWMNPPTMRTTCSTWRLG